MSFTTPWGLLALTAIPAVLVLHLFRRKFRERTVGGLFLFAPDALRAAAGRKRTRLLRSTSLWCELLMALLAALWLAGLDFGGGTESVHVVFVLDDSASMAGENTRGESSATRARARVRELIDDLPDGALTTVILSGTRPSILAGPRVPAALALGTLEAYRPWRPDHDLGVALDLGVDLVGARRGLGAAGASRVHLVTDDLSPDLLLPAGCRLHAVGAPRDNVAILSARREAAEAGREQLFVDVCSFADRSTEVRLQVFATGGQDVRELASEVLTLEPEVQRHVTLTLPASDLPLTVEIENDALSLDNVFRLLPRKPKIVRVFVGWSEGTAEALLTESVLSALPNVVQSQDLSTASLVLGEDPDAIRAEMRMVETAPGGDPEERDTWLGPYLLERRDPLCDGLTLDGVVWTAPRVADLSGFPLVSAGERALMERDESSRRLRLTLYMDPSRSNFAASPDWPILLTNVCDAVRKSLPGPEEPNVLVGSMLRWRRSVLRGSADAGDTAELSLVDPQGDRRPGRGLQLVSFEARSPGLHVLERGVGGETVGQFSVNFADANESDLRDRIDGERNPDPATLAASGSLPGDGADGDSAEDSAGAGGERGRDERRILAWILLIIALVDWLLLRRERAGVGSEVGGEVTA